MTEQVEPMVDTQTACKRLKVGKSYMTQVKKEMGIMHWKRFFLSDVQEHIRLRQQRQQDHQPEASGTTDAPLSRRALGVS